MISLPQLEQARVQYAGLPHRPLRITAVLDAPIISYVPLHLDGLLAYAVVETTTNGQMLPASDGLYAIPLPLKHLWTSEAGLPLWAATDLLPDEEHIRDAIYYHRRAITPLMTERPLRTTAGRHKEKRSPLPALRTDRLTADAEGNPEAIAALLSSIHAIGKKHSTLGRVREWLIEDVDEFSLLDAEGRARRPIPTAFYGMSNHPAAARVGFTPPYWHLAARAPCFDTGMLLPAAGRA